MEPELPSKKDVCLALLEQSVVRVFLDPRRDGVTIPVWLRKQPQLLLDVGLNMPIPIPDLHVGEDALTCTLSFNRAPFFCIVPWTSVFALVGDGDRGMIWPDDVPSELQIHATQSPAKPVQARPKLMAVQNPPDDAADESAPKAAADASADAPKTTESDAAAKPAKLGKVAKEKKRASLQPPALQNGAGAAAKGTEAGKAKKPADRKPKDALRPSPLPTAAAAAGNIPPKDPKEGALKKKRELPPYLRVIK